MVAVPQLHEMKYSETQQSVKSTELTKHWKTDYDVNFPKCPLLKTLPAGKLVPRAPHWQKMALRSQGTTMGPQRDHNWPLNYNNKEDNVEDKQRRWIKWTNKNVNSQDNWRVKSKDEQINMSTTTKMHEKDNQENEQTANTMAKTNEEMKTSLLHCYGSLWPLSVAPMWSIAVSCGLVRYGQFVARCGNYVIPCSRPQ